MIHGRFRAAPILPDPAKRIDCNLSTSRTAHRANRPVLYPPELRGAPPARRRAGRRSGTGVEHRGVVVPTSHVGDARGERRRSCGTRRGSLGRPPQLLGRRDHVLERPRLLEGNLIEKAERAHRDADRTGCQLFLGGQVDQVGANLLGGSSAGRGTGPRLTPVEGNPCSR
jgi:hypothetical protein